MATSTYNAAEIELKRQLLREELARLEDEKLKSIGNMQIIDFHHPERSPGWPIYRFQEYPKLMYHASEKDQIVEAKRLGLRRRNEANPNLAPMDIPPSEPVIRKVKDARDEAQALREGFTAVPLNRQMIDGNSPLEVIGSALQNPLTVPAPTLPIETILELNSMPKAELVKRASQEYGIVLPDEATKVDIISAIQKGVQDGANAA
jgi:hypothetical protein